MPESPKKAGLCSLCDAEVFEVVTFWPDNSPRQLGRPLPGARRDTLLMTDGSQATFTFCDECHPTPENLPRLWARARVALSLEGQNGYRESRKIEPLTPRQQMMTGAAQLQIGRQVPLGLLYSQPWHEVLSNGST